MSPDLFSLPGALDLKPSEMVAFTGAGGKTTLMLALSKALNEQVVMTTTTHLSVSQTRLAPAVIEIEFEDSVDTGESGIKSSVPDWTREWEDELTRFIDHHGSCLVVGEQRGDRVSGVPPELPGRILSLRGVNYLLVEADGSRNKPCKAPGPHEPVVPDGASLVIPMAGIDAVGRPIRQVAHRPEIVSALVGLDVDQELTGKCLADLICHPDGGMKGIPIQSRVIPFLNKVESEMQIATARRVARLTLQNQRVERVILGAVGTDRPVREVHRRITAIVLAAGRSTRMGVMKQLLPWRDTTVLGQTIRNLQESAINDILVVTGFRAKDIEAEVSPFGVKTVGNDRYATGGILSSLQAALRALPANQGAVLVVLADQPMVESETIDLVIHAYWQGRGELLVPAYGDRRGNPVLFGGHYFDELQSLPDGSAPREILKRHPHEVRLVEVGTESIFRDLDRDEDYQRWRPES